MEAEVNITNEYSPSSSSPSSLLQVCTTTLALGSRELAKAGAIVSRLAAIEDMVRHGSRERRETICQAYPRLL